jgi:murein DD-endopeptidase MepM/ murein hydrolase activator NlpD
MLALVASCLMVLPGPVIEPFAPVGLYGGHWGVDVDVAEGEVVVAPLDGTVSFAGEVAGVRSVTVRSGQYRVSLSYLASVDIGVGAVVRRGDPLGTAGHAHGHAGLHLGLRHGDRYVDPVLFSRCGSGMRGTLRLLAPMLPTLPPKD